MVALADLVEDAFTCDCGAEVRALELAVLLIKPGPYTIARSACLECARCELLALRSKRDTMPAPIAADLDELERG